MTRSRTDSYDAIVVGARAAGAATALLLARHGLDVLVVDRSDYGRDTLSTHALMRAGALQLARWGLLDAIRDAGTPPVHRTLFHYGDETVTVDIKPSEGVDALYAPRRTVLDPILVDAAREAGAEVRFHFSVRELATDSSGRVAGILGQDEDGRGVAIRAPITIGADGMSSTVARAVDAPVTRRGNAASAVVYGYFEGIAAAGYEWAYRPGAAAGLIPTNDGVVCVYAGMSAARFRSEVASDIAAGFHAVVAEAFPELPRQLAAGRQVGRFRGFPGVAGTFRRPWGPGWALVGDAAYFKDPITAHGISDALRDAEILARAVIRSRERPAEEAEALAGYERQRDEVTAKHFAVTDAIAGFDWTLGELKDLLFGLSRAMQPENQLLLSLEGSGRAA
jgi:2-polyprenyl-6-methoxyphenol hydroxylase-like FAD-dependent oxidoreductase